MIPAAVVVKCRRTDNRAVKGKSSAFRTSSSDKYKLARQAHVCWPGSDSNANNFGSTFVSFLNLSQLGHQGDDSVNSPKRYQIQWCIFRHMLARIKARSSSHITTSVTPNTHRQSRWRSSARTALLGLILGGYLPLLGSSHRHTRRELARLSKSRASPTRWIASVTFELLLSLQIDQHAQYKLWTPSVSGKGGRTYCTDHTKLSYWQDLADRETLCKGYEREVV